MKFPALSRETLLVVIVLMYGSLSGALVVCIGILKCGWLPLALLFLSGILFATLINQLASVFDLEIFEWETQRKADNYCHKQIVANLHGQNSSLAAQVQECLNKNKQAVDLP